MGDNMKQIAMVGILAQQAARSLRVCAVSVSDHYHSRCAATAPEFHKCVL